MYRKIWDDDSVVVATKLYRSLPLNPIWIRVEFGGMLVTPLAGEMEPGSCVGWLDAVFVECVAESVVVVLGGSTRIVDGIKSLVSVEDLCVGVTDGVDLVLDDTELL